MYFTQLSVLHKCLHRTAFSTQLATLPGCLFTVIQHSQGQLSHFQCMSSCYLQSSFGGHKYMKTVLLQSACKFSFYVYNKKKINLCWNVYIFLANYLKRIDQYYQLSYTSSLIMSNCFHRRLHVLHLIFLSSV